MNERVLLDTNVLSFLLSGKPEAKLCEKYLVGKPIYISFVTEAELLIGAKKANWSAKRVRSLQVCISAFGRIYATPEVVKHFVTVWELTKSQPIPYPYMWIAACALAYDMTLVTHDHHFRRLPRLKVIQSEPPAS